jgi:diguanylate cyclase (GGDEF)-like protein
MNYLSELHHRWLSRHPILYACSLGFGFFALLLSIHVLIDFAPAYRTIYVLPIWLGTRLGGRRAGLVLVCFATLMITWVETQMGQFGEGNFVPNALLRFGVLGIIMLVIAQVEESLLKTRNLALRDPLTGLFNRRALGEFGQDAFGRAQRSERPFVVGLVDLDGFKALNDAHGHEAGDRVLQVLGRVLEDETRGTDLVSRVGGDEFVVLFQDASEAEALAILQRIDQAYTERCAEMGYTSSLSYGLAPMIDGAATIDSLLRTADEEMYRHKEIRGKSRVRD